MNKDSFYHMLIYLWIFLLCLAVCSTKWALDTYAFLSFDETLFTITTPIKSAEKSILNSYYVNGVLSSIILSISFMVLFDTISSRIKKKKHVEPKVLLVKEA